MAVAGSQAQELKQRIENRTARVGIIGLGYVGLPLALLFSEQRFRVTGFDIDESKVTDAQRRRLLHRPHSARRDCTRADERL